MKKEVRLSQLQHSLLIALPFQLAWLVAALVAFLAGGQGNLILVVALVPVLWAPTLLELITKVNLPGVFQLHFHAFVSASAVAGSGLGLYGFVPNWDTIVHAYSGLIFAWLGLFMVRAAEINIKGKLARWFTVLVALAVPLALAVLWELYEYACDVLFGTTMQAGGLEDTIVDMAAAGVGAVIAILIAIWAKAPKSILPRILQ